MRTDQSLTEIPFRSIKECVQPLESYVRNYGSLDHLKTVIALDTIEHLNQLAELFALLKVTNLKDAKQSITGLRERVRFTEDYETLRAPMHARHL